MIYEVGQIVRFKNTEYLRTIGITSYGFLGTIGIIIRRETDDICEKFPDGFKYYMRVYKDRNLAMREPPSPDNYYDTRVYWSGYRGITPECDIQLDIL